MPKHHFLPWAIPHRQCYLALTDLHFPFYQFRKVVAHHLVIIELCRVVLWQQERLAGFPMFIDVGNIGPGVIAVNPAAAEYHPVRVASP